MIDVEDRVQEKSRPERRGVRELSDDDRVTEFIKSTIGKQESSGLWRMNSIEQESIPDLSSFSGLVNFQRINDIRRINKYFEYVNEGMRSGQYIVACLETKNSRKERVLKKYPEPFNRPYYVLDFILKRVLPKWKPTRKIYFHITKGRNRVLSLTEGLARLACCGFEIIDFRKMDYKTWIIAKKVRDPAYDMQPTYGALIKLQRVGKNGKMIKVFKLRTMHPYSEYLQDFVFENFDLRDGGKFNNDFRMTSYGKLFRKYWIDELPMFINYFKGDMKLIGVRPLSRHYFNLYPADMQEMRIRVKPGLIPPYYADLPTGLEEIQESERAYLEAYQEKPFRTDVRYFGKICYNILFRGARSS